VNDLASAREFVTEQRRHHACPPCPPCPVALLPGGDSPRPLPGIPRRRSFPLKSGPGVAPNVFERVRSRKEPLVTHCYERLY